MMLGTHKMDNEYRRLLERRIREQRKRLRQFYIVEEVHWKMANDFRGLTARAEKAEEELAALRSTAPTSGAYDLICCTAEDVATGRGFTGDAAADLAMAQESLRDCLEQLRWRG